MTNAEAAAYFASLPPSEDASIRTLDFDGYTEDVVYPGLLDQGTRDEFLEYFDPEDASSPIQVGEIFIGRKVEEYYRRATGEN